MKAKHPVIAVVGFCFAATLGVAQNFPHRGHPAFPGPTPPANTPPQFGDPLCGLTSSQTTSFMVGQAQFQVVDGPADGLGPIFNGQSCSACHTQPLSGNAIAVGGASAITETRFGNSSGVFDLLHQASLNPSVQDLVPQNSTIVAHRKTTPIFGGGLIEAIPDATITANVHCPSVDGVTGRPAILSDAVTTTIGTNFVGRFGWKCQESTLIAFSGDAYLNEIGVTNRYFTTDIAPDGNTAALIAAEPLGYSLATPTTPTTQLTPATLQDLPANPALPESATNEDDIARFTDFMQMLAPPPPLPLTGAAQQGQAIFTQIDCVACHTPSMQTGQSPIAALQFQNVPLYSDLLLHHMGTLGDGIVQAAAGSDEMRTAPLWGLRARSPFLHDGRAATIDTAIRLHDGEAITVRDRYIQLPPQQQQAVLAFLNSI
jgi:CxxC motif-containing protein (DUF1111 family)